MAAVAVNSSVETPFFLNPAAWLGMDTLIGSNTCPTPRGYLARPSRVGSAWRRPQLPHALTSVDTVRRPVPCVRLCVRAWIIYQ